MNSNQAVTWRSFPAFYAHLDLQLKALANGECVILLPYQARFGNSRGEVHGGIVASLLDIALTQAVWSTLDPQAGIATISLMVNYLASARGELVATGTLMRGGRTVAFAQGEVRDATGNTVCHATGIFRVIPPKSAGQIGHGETTGQRAE